MVSEKARVAAYAFERRRLVTAFVSGRREVEPARTGRVVIGGLVIAGLLVAGFAAADLLTSMV